MKNLTLQSIREKKSILFEKELKDKKKLNDFLLEVKKEMILNKIYYKKAKFQCYTDKLFSYYYKNHSLLFEFNFICDDTLLDKLTIKELLELKNITYFENAIYDQTKEEILLGRKKFSLYDENQEGIDLYNKLSEGLSDDELIDGVYITEGMYLNSDGTYSQF